MVESSVAEAVVILRRGGVVAFPTETYYGLAVDPGNENALKRLYRLKRREPEKAILVLIENSDKITSVAASVPDQYIPLMAKYWPGALTMIFPAKKSLSTILTGNTGTVAVRVSPHPLARALVQTFGKAVTATSANLSGQSPARSASEVRNTFGDRVDYIIDGGQTIAGRCSTLVGIRKTKLIILREGQVDLTNDSNFSSLSSEAVRE